MVGNFTPFASIICIILNQLDIPIFFITFFFERRLLCKTASRHQLDKMLQGKERENSPCLTELLKRIRRLRSASARFDVFLIISLYHKISILQEIFYPFQQRRHSLLDTLHSFLTQHFSHRNGMHISRKKIMIVSLIYSTSTYCIVVASR